MLTSQTSEKSKMQYSISIYTYVCATYVCVTYIYEVYHVCAYTYIWVNLYIPCGHGSLDIVRSLTFTHAAVTSTTYILHIHVNEHRSNMHMLKQAT